MSDATAATAAAAHIDPAQNSHNNSSNSRTVANLSHVHRNSNRNSKRNVRNYQSRQRMHRSSQYDRRADRSRTTSFSKSHSGKVSVNDNSQHQQQQIRIGVGVGGSGAGSLASDEARYNLATRIMSNGVEVIVAGDKSTLPGGHPNQHLRILTTSDTFKMPLTLAPSTLKDHMLLMLPQTTSATNNKNGNGSGDNEDGDASNLDAMHVSCDPTGCGASNSGIKLIASIALSFSQISNDLQIFNQQNQFVTKTCLTTYTYSTTYVQDGTTKIESREKVITNTATEERNAYRIRPTPTSGITLTQVSRGHARISAISILYCYFAIFRLLNWALASSIRPTRI